MKDVPDQDDPELRELSYARADKLRDLSLAMKQDDGRVRGDISGMDSAAAISRSKPRALRFKNQAKLQLSCKSPRSKTIELKVSPLLSRGYLLR